jgi:hypothetical protein
MQRDLERLLRESRSALPDPDPAARRRGIGVVLARIDTGRGRRRVGLFSAAIVALLAASLAVAAERIVRDTDQTQTVTASRIIDRTFRCTPFSLGGGVRDLEVISSPRDRPLLRGTVRATSTGYIGIASGPDTSASDLVIVRARTQERYQQRPQAPGVYANTRRCTRVRRAVSLSPRGLPGPPVRYETDPRCSVRGRVLIRVHATLESAASWLPATPTSAGARKNVVEASIAVRTERTDRPLGLIEINRSGETKLWASANCT